MAASDFIVPNETQRDVLFDIVGHSFGFPAADAKVWLEQSGGIENLRVVTRKDAVVGGLLVIPMGHFFGGRSVSTLGVAGVGVAPAERGKGVGAQMMIAMLREAKAKGFALSSLYPASVTLYRRAGYERAGAKFAFELDPRHVEVARPKDVEVTEAAGAPEELRAFYNRVCSALPGFLDRGAYVWNRVVSPRGKPTKTFLVRHNGALEGYVVLTHAMGANLFPTRVNVTDIAASTARAANAILRLLVEYRSLADKVAWRGSPSELIATMLHERHVEIGVPDFWMIRILDVAKAFAQRGFPRHASGGFTLELDDTSMPESSGRYGISREGVTVGGMSGPTVRLNERALATLYSGFTSARTLAQTGWLEADEDTIVRLDEWFAGPTPTMRDHF